MSEYRENVKQKHSEKAETPEEISILELFPKFVCALLTKETLISFVIVFIVSMCISPIGCINDENGILISIAGFSLASLGIVFSIPNINKLSKKQRENLFAEFVLGIIVPIICLLLKGELCKEASDFLYVLSLLWCIHLGFHLFSLHSLIYIEYEYKNDSNDKTK